MGRKTGNKEPKGGRYVKDAQHPHLFQNSKTGKYYARKYDTEAGALFRSLKTTNRFQAIQEMNRVMRGWLRANPKAGIEPTFDELGEEVLECYQGKALKTFESFEGTFRLHLSPVLGSYPISEVAKHWDRYRALARKKDEELRRLPKYAWRKPRKLYHDRRHTLYILRYAKTQGHLDAVPELAQDPQDKYVPSGREITPRELKALLKKLPKQWRFKIRFLRMTGARADELRQLEWTHIDFAERMIHVPPQIAKTRYGRDYYIADRLLSELKRRKLLSKSRYVCPNKRDLERPESATDKSWQRTKKALGLNVKRHWLRYSAASDAARAGVPMPIIEKGLGLSAVVGKRIYIQVNKKDRVRMAKAMSEGVEE